MRNVKTLPGMLLLLINVMAVVVLAMVSTRLFGAADGARITVAFTVAYLVPLVLLCRARGTNYASQLLLLLLAVFLSWVAINSMLYWIELDGYSLQRPNLEGDAREYYKWALYRYDGSVEPTSTVFPGFPLVMLTLWKMFGLSVVWPLALNMMCTMLSVVLTGMTTRRLLAHRVTASHQALVLCGMFFTCLLCYYLMAGISILKEGILFLSVSLAGFALSSMDSSEEERHRLVRDIALFVFACLMMALVRTTFLYVLLLGVLVMTVPHWRRDWVLSLSLIALIGVLVVVGNHFASYSFGRHAEIASGGWNMQRIYYSKAVYMNLIGYYFLYSPLHKLALLPVTMSLQFILPLPWMQHFEEPYLQCFISRINYGWYLVGAISMFYVVFLSWRRGVNMGAWPWWPVIYYIALAYVMGGAMARYLLPVEPLLVPVVVYVICLLCEGRWRRSFIVWMICLAIVLTIALLLCLEIQTGLVSKWLNTPSLLADLKSLFHIFI